MRYVFGFLMVLAVLGFVACGGEEQQLVELCAAETDFWRKDNPPPLGPDTMEGTYTLDHFIIDLYIDDENVGSIDSSEFESFSGTLDLQESTISATVTIEEETETMSGSYTKSSGGDEGNLHVVDATGSYLLYYRFVPSSDDTLLLLLSNSAWVCEMTTL